MAMGNSHPNMVDPDGGLAGWEGIPAEATGAFSVMKFAQVVGSLASIQVSGDAQSLNKAVGNINTPRFKGGVLPEFSRTSDGKFSQRREGEAVGFAIDFSRTFKTFGADKKWIPWKIKVQFGEYKTKKQWVTIEDHNSKTDPDGFVFDRALGKNQRAGFYNGMGKATSSFSGPDRPSGMFTFLNPYLRGGTKARLKINSAPGNKFLFKLQEYMPVTRWHPWKISFH